jgi:hypothetical protein
MSKTYYETHEKYLSPGRGKNSMPSFTPRGEYNGVVRERNFLNKLSFFPRCVNECAYHKIALPFSSPKRDHDCY